MGMNCNGITDVGQKRNNNQDYFVIKELSEKLAFMIVCDGMGGAAGGSEASSIAAETFADFVLSNITKENKEEYIAVLEGALEKANKAVYDRAASKRSLEGMGTTVAACIYDGESYYTLWVGDSRIYAVTDKGILQLSHDHSYVQSLVDSGKITKQEAKLHPNRNIITKAVGTEEYIEGDVCKIDSTAFRGIMLCSDGLCGYVEEKDIERVLLEETDSKQSAERLVQMANESGGYDNITVIVHYKR